MKRYMVFAVLALFPAATHSLRAGTIYPLAPKGTSVALDPNDFIRSVPTESPGLPSPNPVIGDNLGQHPGAFGVGFPAPGLSFVGVFGGQIDTGNPAANLYLWEVELVGLGDTLPFEGPIVQLGSWNGTAFRPVGNPVTVSYWDTGVASQDRDQTFKEILSDVIPLSDFSVPIGLSSQVNAVQVTSTFGHDMVNAIATDVVPEPSAILLLGLGMLGLLATACNATRRPSAVRGKSAPR